MRSATPPKYHQARLADFSRSLIEAVVLWLGAPTEGLLLTGATGSGKTHLACGMMRVMFELGKSPLFCRAADLYLEIRNSYGAREDDPNEKEIMEGYCEVSLLVLDDIGSGSLSDHERAVMLNLLDRRGNARLPTIVTTNMSLEEIGAKMDERIASRLKGYTAIAFTGADRRGRRASTSEAGA